MKITEITMKQASHYLLLCVIMIIGLSSCHEDVIGEMETTTNTQQPDIKQVTQGDVAGYVYDENNDPVAGAEVTILGRSIQTNEFGVYVFRNATLDQNGTYIKATKQGYILGSDKIYPNTASGNYSYIKLLQLTTDQTFNASEGGTMPILGGGTVVFPAAAIVDNSGESYSGSVFITAKRIAANDPDIQDMMPGGLVAEDNEGYTRVLGTFGMVAVELRDANGNELNLAEGSKATVTFPIIDNMLSTAPEQIELWSFNEDRGLWIEEGFATKDGSNYIGEVAHFSFWNCDAPFPLIHLCGNVQYENGETASNISIQVNANITWGTSYGNTDSEGGFCGKMPKGEELTLTFYYVGCQQQNGYTITVGPFDTDTDLGDIIIPNGANTATITGTVVCNGEPITDASLLVTVGDNSIVLLANENGMFEFASSLFGCNPSGEATIVGINNETGEASLTSSFMINENNSLELNTCSDCNLDIAIETDNTDPCNLETFTLSAVVTGGSGNYEFNWSTGSNDQVISDITNELYCVTITDLINDCQEILCQQFNVVPLSDSTYVNPSYCGTNNGQLNVFPFGGTGPYSINIVDENNTTISTSQETNDLAPGTYTITIMDDNGCTITDVQSIDEYGIPYPEVFTNCETGAIIFPQDVGSPYFISWNTGELFTNQVSNLAPGEYCFTVENNQGCVEDFCVTVEIPDMAPPTLEITCNYPNWTINFGNIYSGSYFGGNIDTIFTFQESIQINPLQFGYYGELYLTEDFGVCDYNESITLPNFQGLVTNAVPATCSTCNDGYIEINLNTTAACVDCNVGSTRIYTVDDTSLLTDLSDMNELQMLPSGSYFVVVTDEESGCIIAHELVQL